MNQEIYNICEWVVDEVRKKGAACKVVFSKRRFVDIRYRKQRPEIIKEAATQELDLNLYVNGKYSSQSTPDMRKQALEKFISDAVINTGFVEEDPFRTLPGNDLYQGREERDLHLYDNKHSDFTHEARHTIAKTIEEACLEAGGEKVISAEAGFNDDEWEELVLTSNGFEGTSKATGYRANVSMTIQDEGNRRPNGYYRIASRFVNDLPSPVETGHIAVQKTLDLLGAKKLETKKLPVIVENRVVSALLRGFLSGLYGNNIRQKRSFLSGMKGKLTGSKLLTLIDDPFIEKGFGSRLYDDDGFPAKKRIIISEGKIEEYFIDWYSSRKLNCPPTTGGPSNLLIPQGNKSIAELMCDLDSGILITGFIGGNSNSTTGDFSIGITGKLFEKGTPVQSVAEMNIADNHLNFWKKLIAVGNDPWKFSNWIMPSLVFDEIMVGGI